MDGWVNEWIRPSVSAKALFSSRSHAPPPHSNNSFFPFLRVSPELFSVIQYLLCFTHCYYLLTFTVCWLCTHHCSKQRVQSSFGSWANLVIENENMVRATGIKEIAQTGNPAGYNSPVILSKSLSSVTLCFLTWTWGVQASLMVGLQAQAVERSRSKEHRFQQVFLHFLCLHLH